MKQKNKTAKSVIQGVQGLFEKLPLALPENLLKDRLT